MLPPDDNFDPADPYDGPWKLGIDAFLPELMLVLYPASHAEIDWSRSYRPLNAELQKVLAGDGTARFADALYQVWRQDGREQWIILHLEVQSQPDPDLPRRMWVYAYRCFEKHQQEVFGYAILGDRNPGFRPGPYTWQLGKARLVYEYETAKLIDIPVEELEASDNPAALLILAHLYTAETKNDQERRRRFKLRLVRLLSQKGYDRSSIEKLFGILDWMLRLVPEQSIIFSQEVLALRKEPDMSGYVNTLEWYFTNLGIEKGIEQGRQLGRGEGVVRVLRSQLERRFGDLPAWADSRLADADAETLERWSLQVLDARRLEDVFA